MREPSWTLSKMYNQFVEYRARLYYNLMWYKPRLEGSFKNTYKSN